MTDDDATAGAALAGDATGAGTEPADEPPGRAPAPAAAPTPALATSIRRARVAAFSYFFPAHDEEANIEALVGEALETLPALADRFEIIAVDDGSTDGTPAIADRLEAEHPGVVRAVHHPVNRGYGAALRTGFAAARYPVVGFTDGDRQFRVADLGRLLDALEPDRPAVDDRPAGEPDEPGGSRPSEGVAEGASRSHAADATSADATSAAPDAVVGYRIRRADAPVRLVYARLYRLALRLFFGLGVRDVDCACKVFRRDSLHGVRLESGGAFLSAEMLIKFRARGGRLAQVGVPHYPRTAGRASGANPAVVLRAVRDFWMLRLRLWANRRAALRRGTPVVE